MGVRCEVCGMPIVRSQHSCECIYCGRAAHEHCGGYLTDGQSEAWACAVCWDDMLSTPYEELYEVEEGGYG